MQEVLQNHQGKIMGLLQSTASMHADMSVLEDEVLRMTSEHRLLSRQLHLQVLPPFIIQWN